MRRLSVKVAALGLLGIALFFSSYFLTEKAMSKSLGYRWMNTDTALKFNIPFNDTWTNAIKRGMSAWNAASSKKPMSQATPSEGFANDFYTVNDTSLTWLGKMFPIHRDGYLSSTDIAFNLRYSFSDGAASGKYDIQSVATHELGHSLGIAHCHEKGEVHTSGDAEFTMYPELNSNTTKYRTLETYDKQSKIDIYGR